MKGACPGGSSQTLVAPHRPTRPSEFGSKSSTLLVEGWGTGSGAGRLGDLTHSPDSHPGRDFSCPHRAPAEKPGEPPPSPQLHPSLSPDPSPGTLPPYFFSTPDPHRPPLRNPGCVFLTLKLCHLGLLLLQRLPQGHLGQRGGSEHGLLSLGAGRHPRPWNQRSSNPHPIHFPANPLPATQPPTVKKGHNLPPSPGHP